MPEVPSLITRLIGHNFLWIKVFRADQDENRRKGRRRRAYAKQHCMRFEHVRGTIRNGSREAKGMLLKRLVQQRDAGTIRGINLGMDVPPKPGHRRQGLSHLPLVLDIETKPILTGELIEDVERDGVVPVVEAIGESVRESEFQKMLSFQIVDVLFKNLIDIPSRISKTRKGSHTQIK